ncbi:MAG: cytochrome c maturation protein CcmE [Anaerolineales bacterium]
MSSASVAVPTASPKRSKFLVGGLLIVAAIVYLIASTTTSTSQFFYTIEELQAQGAAAVGENVRISGAVIGDTITYDANSLELRFTAVNMPGDQSEIDAQGGLAAVLHRVVSDPAAPTLQVLYVGPKPDLLQHEAQAIMDGHIGEDGVFYADTLLLKCPTRYEDEIPGQTAN